MHLDLETDDIEAEVTRLEALGATRWDHQAERGWDFWVLHDPWGNEFCVLPPMLPGLLARRDPWDGIAEPGLDRALRVHNDKVIEADRQPDPGPVAVSGSAGDAAQERRRARPAVQRRAVPVPARRRDHAGWHQVQVGEEVHDLVQRMNVDPGGGVRGGEVVPLGRVPGPDGDDQVAARGERPGER